jgi:ubiquinone/menaquinone biosynthesis C-methylase UbiE
MKNLSDIGLGDVKSVYSGPEGQLWELVMGQQIHIGGFRSSMDLAQRAGIGAGLSGIDLCCCSGAGMRILVRFCNVARMQGVDATTAMVELGRRRTEAEGYQDRINFTLADACDTGLPAASADFVWGEDAWCYVDDKPALIREVARLAKPQGTIAFTDWMEGPAGLSDAEAERFLRFMKFANVQSLPGYTDLLNASRCKVSLAADTGRFASHVDLYLEMLDKQLTSDALRILDYNVTVMEGLAGEMKFLQQLAHDGKIIQGLVVANKCP